MNVRLRYIPNLFVPFRQLSASVGPLAELKRERNTPPVEHVPITFHGQYQHLKQQFPPHYLLAMQNGDFYEFFDEDAEKCAGILGIILTSKSYKHLDKPLPFCGFPVRVLDNMMGRFCRAGVYLILADQESAEPSKESKIGPKFSRKVTRIVTPGTITDDGLLDDHFHNYICSVHLHVDAPCNVSWLDLSTGEYHYAICTLSELEGHLHRISPRELLIDTQHPAYAAHVAPLVRHSGTCTTPWAQGSSSMHMMETYIQRTQKLGLPEPVLYSASQIMSLPATSVKSLELLETQSGNTKCSLFNVINQTCTKFGSRLLSQRIKSPLTDKKAILSLLDAVEHFRSRPLLLAEIRNILKKVPDAEKSVQRLIINRFHPMDFNVIRSALEAADELSVIMTLDEFGGFKDPIFRSVASKLEKTLDHEAKIRKDFSLGDLGLRFQESSTLKDGSNSRLDVLKAKYIQLTGKGHLTVNASRDHGHVIVLKANEKGMSEFPELIKLSTNATIARYKTADLINLDTNIATAESQLRGLEILIFQDLRSSVLENQTTLKALINLMSRLDVICSFAHMAAENHYVRPTFGDQFVIEGGRHPTVEQNLLKNFKNFVKNDCLLDKFALITGPNMGGKSTFMRQTAVICLLAQCGSYVPADRAILPILDGIFTRVGASDDLSRDKSTFMVEMTETAHILREATSRSLVLLDEIGRGTSTHEGYALALAISRYLIQHINCKTLFATHYHALGPILHNHHKDVSLWKTIADVDEEGKILFHHRIQPGTADKSYGIEVAKLSGIPPAVLEEAREILAMQESATV